MPGLAFLLAVGQHLPLGTEQAATAPCPERYISNSRNADMNDLIQLQRLIARSRHL
jgi:hypothetical protein